MNIWFDISNSPQVILFCDLIGELEREGHIVTVTSRPLANTVPLLDQRNIKHTIIGKHYGKNFLKKLFGYPIRVMQLRNFLKRKKLDLAISQSSFHSPLVAKLLGIPSIFTNDNEHAMGNIPSFLFATKIFIPENLSIDKVIKKGALKKKITQYGGLKEGIYLWRLGETIYQKRTLINDSKIKIYVRPEPLTAEYYKGGLNFLDDALISLQDKFSITILARNNNQLDHFKQAKFSAINVPELPMNFTDIACDCSLFIGAGGSMTREMAILGIPTISVYQDELLDVDTFLIRKKLMLYEPDITANKIICYINTLNDAKPDTELLIKGKATYNFFKSEILKFKPARDKYSIVGKTQGMIT